MYCNGQYEIIKKMCYENKQYFDRTLRPNTVNLKDSNFEQIENCQKAEYDGKLNIEFELNPNGEFKTKLLQTKIAYITEYHIGNIRSQARYRHSRAKELRIKKLYVSLSKPSNDD